MLQLRDHESVLCSAHQAYYHERNLQLSFFFFSWKGVGKRERVLGFGEGGRHASNGMVSTLYISIRLTVSLNA